MIHALVFLKMCYLLYRSVLISFVLILSLYTGMAGEVQPEKEVTFQEDTLKTYHLDPLRPSTEQAERASTRWIKAWPTGVGNLPVEVSWNLVIQLSDSDVLDGIIDEFDLKYIRRLGPSVFHLRAGHAEAAADVAHALASRKGVIRSYPELRRNHQKSGPYSRLTNDPYLRDTLDVNSDFWHLENRDELTGEKTGIDINVRSAWPVSKGTGVVIGIVDDGMDLDHPDLIGNKHSEHHFDFFNNAPGGEHGRTSQFHGTAVAGLAVAELGNGRGGAGVAPDAEWVSMNIFSASDRIAGDLQLADALQYHIQIIDIQNHSWGNASSVLGGPSLIERMALTNSVLNGRNGLGVIQVRAGGNRGEVGGNVNDDGYASDPLAIAVGALRDDGRVAEYSSPGACVLVSGPSGETGFQKLFTTDPVGDDGLNGITFESDLADYGFLSFGFSGTSGSCPIISGIVALILETNPQLHYRDVQQILALASEQSDQNNPNLQTNRAGLVFSHLTGFGLLDAGRAVQIAKDWQSRPAYQDVTYISTEMKPIADDALLVVVQGDDVPAELTQISASGSQGPVPDVATAVLPLVHVEQAIDAIEVDLTGKGALIQRGGSLFGEKLSRAEDANAAFGIVYNNRDEDSRIVLGGTKYNTLTAVMISQNDGEALRDLIETNSTVTVGLQTVHTEYEFEVTESLVTEHVGVRLRADHTSRGDLRVILTSPYGTKSVMQFPNGDISEGPEDWTYWSVAHFFEPSAGTWKVQVSDQSPEFTGNVLEVNLLIKGVTITDSDVDGLDDSLEMQMFGDLSQGPEEDLDLDGDGNLLELLVASDPTVDERVFKADLSPLFDDLLRLSWPSVNGVRYSLETVLTLDDLFMEELTFDSTSRVSELIVPADLLSGFVRIKKLLD